MVNRTVERIVVGKTRIRDEDNFYGTILYLGLVASAKKINEEYAGISWDDTTRGKHDGSVICRRTNQLVRHFHVPHPHGASFLRSSKLDFGVILDADLCATRYVKMEAPLVAPDNIFPDAAARTISGRTKPIEFHGEIKLRMRQQLGDLSSISLRLLSVSAIDTQSLASKVSHLTEVDLAGNLLWEWSAVWDLLQCLPALSWLSLASNRLGDFDERNDSKRQQATGYPQMRVLNLYKTNLSRVPSGLLGLFPNLHEVCLSSNEFSSLRSSDRFDLKDLVIMDLSSCGLSAWEQVVQLVGSLPCLESLAVNDNPIATLSCGESTNDVEVFSSLTSLHLSSTKISSWKELEMHLPASVRHLQLRKTPLTADLGAAEARFLAVARLPNIVMLNASRVSKHERTEAERRYVNLVSRQLVLANEDQGKRQTLLDEHSQLERLLEKHRESLTPISSVNGDKIIGTNGLTATTINVTILSMAAASCTHEPIRKRLPCTLTVGRLQALLSRLLELPTNVQVLHYRTNEQDAFPTVMDNPEHTLAYYGVSDDCEIIVNEIDPEEQERKAHLEKQAFEDRLAQQEREVDARQEAMRRVAGRGRGETQGGFDCYDL